MSSSPTGELLTLPGDAVFVRYTPGSLDRAARLQTRLAELLDKLADWGEFKMRLAVFVLSPEDWQQHGITRPYGFSARVSGLAVAAPAWGTPESVGLWRRLLGPALPAAAEFSVRGTPDQVASQVLADAFAQLDACRMFVEREQLASAADGPWLADLFAHVACLTFDQQSPTPPPLDLGLILHTIADRTPPSALASYRSDLELDAWLWHQAQLARAAELIWREDGKRSVRNLFKLRKKKGSPLRFNDLLVPHPALGEWHRSSFPTAQPAG